MSTLCIYKCPVCNKALIQNGKAYQCSQKHSYDISKYGYVNLLLANQMNSKEPGDNKEMMTARHSFLDRGYFEQLSNNINSIVTQHLKACDRQYTVFDVGCGEGYYTNKLHKALEGCLNVEMYGMDISREAVRLAAKRNRSISLCVGSVSNLPLLPHSVDCIVNVFAPFKEEEFSRVLKNKGIVVKVTPGAEHLFGLKEALYDNPYLNDENIPKVSSLEAVESINIKYDIQIEDSQDIINLLKMTPYYWNTNISRVQEFTQQVSKLDTTLDFVITVFKKNKGEIFIC
ncbi:MAG: methyltransferase domain-containing protein [Lutisporaceae bacterium]